MLYLFILNRSDYSLKNGNLEISRLFSKLSGICENLKVMEENWWSDVITSPTNLLLLERKITELLKPHLVLSKYYSQNFSSVQPLNLFFLAEQTHRVQTLSDFAVEVSDGFNWFESLLCYFEKHSLAIFSRHWGFSADIVYSKLIWVILCWYFSSLLLKLFDFQRSTLCQRSNIE